MWPTGLIGPIYTVHVGPRSRGGRGESGHATLRRRNPSEKACYLAPRNAPKEDGTGGFDFDFSSIRLTRVSGPPQTFPPHSAPWTSQSLQPFFFFLLISSLLFCFCYRLHAPTLTSDESVLNCTTSLILRPRAPCAINPKACYFAPSSGAGIFNERPIKIIDCIFNFHVMMNGCSCVIGGGP